MWILRVLVPFLGLEYCFWYLLAQWFRVSSSVSWAPLLLRSLSSDFVLFGLLSNRAGYGWVVYHSFLSLDSIFSSRKRNDYRSLLWSSPVLDSVVSFFANSG